MFERLKIVFSASAFSIIYSTTYSRTVSSVIAKFRLIYVTEGRATHLQHLAIFATSNNASKQHSLPHQIHITAMCLFHFHHVVVFSFHKSVEKWLVGTREMRNNLL